MYILYLVSSEGLEPSKPRFLGVYVCQIPSQRHMVEEARFELALVESKSTILPLDYSSINGGNKGI